MSHRLRRFHAIETLCPNLLQSHSFRSHRLRRFHAIETYQNAAPTLANNKSHRLRRFHAIETLKLATQRHPHPPASHRLRRFHAIETPAQQARGNNFLQRRIDSGGSTPLKLEFLGTSAPRLVASTQAVPPPRDPVAVDSTSLAALMGKSDRTACARSHRVVSGSPNREGTPLGELRFYGARQLPD